MGASSGIERPRRRQVAASHLAAEQRRVRRPEVAAVAEGEAAGAAQTLDVPGGLTMAGPDDEPVFVVGDGEIGVHALALGAGEAHLIEQGLSIAFAELPLTVVTAQGKRALEGGDDRRLGARRQQV